MSYLLVAQRGLTVPGWVKDALWRAAKATPSLDLPFADSKSLVDAITGRQLVTFARAGSGTYTDSAGVLRTATTNLLLQSEDFGTTWFLTSATLSANAIAAPNGTLTAEQLVEAATTANHEAGQTFASPVANATYTLSCYLKAATSTTCGIRFSNGLNGTGIICSVDLTAQTVTVTAGTGTATIANVGSGWFRVSLTATASGTPASTTVSIFRSIGTAGSIANSIYLWGAQLEQSSTVGEYIPTGSTINSAPRFDHRITSTTTNLAIRSEEFDNATWVQTGLNAFGSGSVANAIAAPDGTVTGDLIEEDTSTGFHRVSQTLISGTISTGTYTASVYVKAAQRSRAYISLDDNATGEVTAGFATLTQAFTITTAGSWSGSTASIEDVGNGWFRISLTSTKGDGSSALTLRVGIAQVNVTTISYTGNGTAGLYVWGAQLVASDSNGRYVRTTAAAASFSTTESLGLLVEEQRTNLLLQSNAFTTHWSSVANTLTSASAVSPDGTTNGWRFADTAANNTHNIFQAIAWTAVATTFTVYAKYDTHRWIGARIGNTGNQFFGSWDLQNGVVGSFTAGATIGMQAVGNGWYRLTLTATLTSAGSANVLLYLNNADSASAITYAGTGTGSYIYGAQLEAGATASSYIPTTTAAATRNADVAQITGTNFSSWYRQDEGTWFGDAFREFAVPAGQFPVIVDCRTSGGSPNVNQFSYLLESIAGTYIAVGGVLQSELYPPVPGGTRRRRVASAYSANNFAASANGSTTLIDSTGSVGNVPSMTIGSVSGTGQYLNGHIRRIAFWPQALPGQLQAITQP